MYKAGGGTATVSGNTVVGNSAVGTIALGLGIFASAGADSIVYVRTNNVTNNSPTTEDRGSFAIGTAAFAGGRAFIENNTVSANFGGIIASGNGVTEVNDNSVTGNFATGVSLNASRGGTMRSARNTIAGNHSSFAGGGLGLNAQLGASITVKDTTAAGNTSKRFGAGVYAFLRAGGSIEIVGTTISDNCAVKTENPDSGYAGGVSVNNDGGSMTIVQSTISANSAATDGGGIWVDNLTEGGVVIRHSTITKNTADSDDDGSGGGGGIFVWRGAVNLDHTIVAGSYDNSGAAPDLAGIFNANRSLIGIGGNYLGPLADNGGPTLTHALLPGSPAINAGDPAAMAGVGGVPVNDQRGAPFTRVYGGRIDIGAFESQPNPLAGDYNFDGVVDAGDYVLWRKLLGTMNSIADGDGSGVVDQTDGDIWRTNFGRRYEDLVAAVAVEGAGAGGFGALVDVKTPTESASSATSPKSPTTGEKSIAAVRDFVYAADDEPASKRNASRSSTKATRLHANTFHGQGMLNDLLARRSPQGTRPEFVSDRLRDDRTIKDISAERFGDANTLDAVFASLGTFCTA